MMIHGLLILCLNTLLRAEGSHDANAAFVMEHSQPMDHSLIEHKRVARWRGLRQDAHAVSPAGCRAGMCNVVIVTDMQKDYCLECGTSTVSPWAALSLPEGAEVINKILRSEFVHLSVFTKDWLPKTASRPYLTAGEAGTEILDALYRPPNSFEFTKDVDDWMNQLDPASAYDRKYHYALNGETLPRRAAAKNSSDAYRPSLFDVLKASNYLPGNTRLIVTGVAANRCVMKGAVHARELGYDVVVVREATFGDAQEPEKWTATTCAQALGVSKCRSESDRARFIDGGQNARGWAPVFSCEATFDLGAEPCDDRLLSSWRKMVYLGHKGGPTRRDSFKYMSAAGAKVVDTVEEVTALMRSTDRSGWNVRRNSWLVVGVILVIVLMALASSSPGLMRRREMYGKALEKETLDGKTV
eukprot:TRINITY_DN3816_c0_g1_i2.p1 TRINITY_DN3816_c0_g1~~TRINITY_DN3816_c0_g1_i2.p1  ORF type:complete len:414 (-),score=46.19 TRINITY_DN3816_c0_g1_i2:410-1651(-)